MANAAQRVSRLATRLVLLQKMDQRWHLGLAQCGPARPGSPAMGRQPEPSLGILDSQTVKATEAGGERGYDGGKKMNGRKRHILVDTSVSYSNWWFIPPISRITMALGWCYKKRTRNFSRLQKVIADGMYTKNGLVEWVKQQFPLHPGNLTRDKEQKGFCVLPKPWIVERSLPGVGRNRILSKEYEHLTQTSESDVLYCLYSDDVAPARTVGRLSLIFRQPLSADGWTALSALVAPDPGI